MNLPHYVDVHTHLTHPEFKADLEQVIQRAHDANLGAIVVNGLGPNSNREILQLSAKYPIIKAALGIYPIEAVNEHLPTDFKIPCERFSVKDEIRFIESQAKEGKILAIGECGLDAHHLEAETFGQQEQVFSALIQIAMKSDIPVIVHSRKREQRVFEILAEHGITKVNMHCYSGKTKWAIDAAETWGWRFSIPANLERSHSFQTLAKKLPPECLLTETDAPYLGPEPGVRNDPANVVRTIRYLSTLRAWTEEEARDRVWKNYLDLFAPPRKT